MKAPDIIYMPEVILDESWAEKLVDTDICYIRKDLVPNEGLPPTPLTPEILEKNGFVKTEENEFVHSYHLVIPITSKENSSVIQMSFYKDPIAGVNTLFKCWNPTPPDYEGLNEMHLCNLESVHELQHALKLCKIEKQIKL